MFFVWCKRWRCDCIHAKKIKIESKRAADTLTELLDPQNPPGVRRAAANDILNYVLKFRENESLLFEVYEED